MAPLLGRAPPRVARGLGVKGVGDEVALLPLPVVRVPWVVLVLGRLPALLAPLDRKPPKDRRVD